MLSRELNQVQGGARRRLSWAACSFHRGLGLDDPGSRRGGSPIPLRARLIEDALGPSVVIVDEDERPSVPDTGVVILGLIRLKAEIGQRPDEATPHRTHA